MFHYSCCIDDLDSARAFYVDVIGATEGRRAKTWIDFDFFGNQLSLHLGAPTPTERCGDVDGVRVPMPHFGAILEVQEFQALVERLRVAGVGFIFPPTLRFADQPDAQWTLFVADPSGNALEFKAFEDPAAIFGRVARQT
ncbi:MAG: VOC family protein [Pseudomonadota bacterium]